MQQMVSEEEVNNLHNSRENNLRIYLFGTFRWISDYEVLTFITRFLECNSDLL